MFSISFIHLGAEGLYQPDGVVFDYFEGLVSCEPLALLLVFVPLVLVPLTEEIVIVMVFAVLFIEVGPVAAFIAKPGTFAVAFAVGQLQTLDEQLKGGYSGPAGLIFTVPAFVADANELFGQVSASTHSPGRE